MGKIKVEAEPGFRNTESPETVKFVAVSVTVVVELAFWVNRRLKAAFASPVSAANAIVVATRVVAICVDFVNFILCVFEMMWSGILSNSGISSVSGSDITDLLMKGTLIGNH